MNWKKIDAATENLLKKAEETYQEVNPGEDKLRDVRAAADILQAPLRAELERIHSLVGGFISTVTGGNPELIALRVWHAERRDPAPLPRESGYEVVQVKENGEIKKVAGPLEYSAAQGVLRDYVKFNPSLDDFRIVLVTREEVRE